MTANGGPEPIPLLAHRGYAARYPENTLPALAAAVSAGASLLEFDVQLTADRVPLLLHDDDFQRTGDNPSRVLEITAAQAADIDVSEPERLGNAHRNVSAPLLADVVTALVGWPQVTAFVELKRQSIEHFGAGVVLDAVLPALEPVSERCVLISFNEEVLRLARGRTNYPIGWALRAWDSEHYERARDLQPDYLFCNVLRLPTAKEDLWVGDWTWVAYEVVDPSVARELAGWGIGIIETMAYAELARGLGQT